MFIHTIFIRLTCLFYASCFPVLVIAILRLRCWRNYGLQQYQYFSIKWWLILIVDTSFTRHNTAFDNHKISVKIRDKSRHSLCYIVNGFFSVFCWNSFMPVDRLHSPGSGGLLAYMTLLEQNFTFSCCTWWEPQKTFG